MCVHVNITSCYIDSGLPFLPLLLSCSIHRFSLSPSLFHPSLRLTQRFPIDCPSSTPQIKAYFIRGGIYNDPINCRASPVLLLLRQSVFKCECVCVCVLVRVWMCGRVACKIILKQLASGLYKFSFRHKIRQFENKKLIFFSSQVPLSLSLSLFLLLHLTFFLFSSLKTLSSSPPALLFAWRGRCCSSPPLHSSHCRLVFLSLSPTFQRNDTFDFFSPAFHTLSILPPPSSKTVEYLFLLWSF